MAQVGMMDPRQLLQTAQQPQQPSFPMPDYQGLMTKLAYQMAGAPPQALGSTGGGATGIVPSAPLAPAMPANAGGSSTGTNSAQNKASGAATGALTGWQVGGPFGAVVGGVGGYALNGGAKDLNPIEASGLTGLSMDQAWEDGNLARLGSNPAGALAGKYIGANSALSPTSWGLGINENSFFGRALDPVQAMDPAGIFGGHDNPEEKTRDAYYDQLSQGIGTSDPKTFTEGVTGEFRADRSTYPPRASGMYGPKDDDKVQADLASKINSAYASGAIGPSDSAWSIYDKVVTPWFNTMGDGMSGSKAPEKHSTMTIDMINRYMSGGPITWQEARGGKPDYEIPKYLGLGG
jgi:hypothetical protein